MYWQQHKYDFQTILIFNPQKMTPELDAFAQTLTLYNNEYVACGELGL